MSDRITCPSCGFEIAVSETLAAQIRQQLRQEIDVETQRKSTELAKRQDTVRQKEELLEAARLSLEQDVANRVAQAQERLLHEAEIKANQAVSLEIQDLEEQLATAKGRLVETQKAELELRKERRELETRQQELQLTVTRTLDSERAALREQAKQEADEQYRLKEADMHKLVADLRNQIGDLKRKSEQGSQQAQGEVMEQEIETVLRQLFPLDTLDPVPVGVHGGDVLQHVHDESGKECGAILWESKRTKAWSDAWLPKLRDDQRAAKAHLSVLATEELPKGLLNFGCIEGNWVTNRACLAGLATALRAGLLELGRTRAALQGQQTKMEFLYEYLSGPEFSQRVAGIVEAFTNMKRDLDSEKRAMHRLWAKREKQLERATLNCTALYGDVGGFIDADLQHIPELELAAIGDGSQAEELAKAPWD
jgi:hypothetical protein